MPDRPEVFHLDRLVDHTGISGTGCVAWGVCWPDGTVALRWCSETPSTVLWDSMDAVERVHGHNGSTRIVWEGQ